MDGTRLLRQHFPEAGDGTRLIILGNATRVRIGKKPLQLTRYSVGDNQTLWAAYDQETDTIYVRLVQQEDRII